MSDQDSTTIHRLVSTVITETDLTDPREIALAVADSTPDDLVREFYVAGLVAEVRNVLAAQRNRAMTNALTPGRSAKLSQRRDWWAEMLASRIHVGGAKWMTLGDCTATELAFAAAERRADAERELKRAESYDQLAALLAQHSVQTVAELPADVARDALAVAA